MVKVRFERVLALPSSAVANTIYFVKPSGAQTLSIYVSGNDGVPIPALGGAPTPTPTPAPSFATQPTITGTVKVGQPLSTLTYNDGTPLNGTITTRAILLAGVAKAGTYVLVDADLSKAVTYQNIATGVGAPATATSAAVTVQAADVTPAPTGDAGFKLVRKAGTSPTVFPPQVTLVMEYVFNSGDVLHARYSSDYTFATGVTNLPDHTFTDAEIQAGQYPDPFKAITSGVTYMQARINNGPWTVPLMHGDGAAPTLTSSLSVSGYQGTAGASQPTADKPFTLQQEGGSEADDFYFVGAVNPAINWYAVTASGPHKLRFRLVSLAGVAGAVQELVLNAAVNTPSAHTFTPVANAALDSDVTSADGWTMDIAPGTTVPLSVAGGSYLKNGTAGTATTTVANGDVVKARGHTPSSNNSGFDVAVTAGSTTAHFVVSTPTALTSDTTFDPANIGSDLTLSADKRTVSRVNNNTGPFRTARSTTAKSGKRYAEFTNISGPVNAIGIINGTQGLNNTVGYDEVNGNAWNSDGGRGTNGSDNYSENASLPGSRGYGDGDVIGITWDSTTQFFTFYRNGVMAWTAKNTNLGTAPYLSAGLSYNNSSVSLNTGHSAFAYTPPTGFIAWDV